MSHQKVEDKDDQPDDDQCDDRWNQDRDQRAPRRESMHLADALEGDDESPKAEHPLDDEDFVKGGIDLRQRTASNRTISAAIAGTCDHATAARTSTRLATPPMRLPDHLKITPKMYRKRTPSAA